MAEAAEGDPNNNEAIAASEKRLKTSDKFYSLRPRFERKRGDSDDEEIVVTWKKRSKRRTKQKPAPLSKYRRKTANARERSRMREINEAFDNLRRAVPHATSPDPSDKLTKISTLRLAMRYIEALSSVLAEPAPSTASDAGSSNGSGVVPASGLFFPPTPPISNSPLSPPPDDMTFTEIHDFDDPFDTSPIDLDDFLFP